MDGFVDFSLETLGNWLILGLVSVGVLIATESKSVGVSIDAIFGMIGGKIGGSICGFAFVMIGAAATAVVMVVVVFTLSLLAATAVVAACTLCGISSFLFASAATAAGLAISFLHSTLDDLLFAIPISFCGDFLISFDGNCCLLSSVRTLSSICSSFDSSGSSGSVSI